MKCVSRQLQKKSNQMEKKTIPSEELNLIIQFIRKNEVSLDVETCMQLFYRTSEAKLNSQSFLLN